MILIMVCGFPVAGKTTTTQQIVDACKARGISTTTVYKVPKAPYNPSLVNFGVYQWLAENTAEICIVDGVLMNSFDRAEIIEMADNTAATFNRDLRIVAVSIDRNRTFINTHNKDEDHVEYKIPALIAMCNIYQQPIVREGFDMIHRVVGSRYIEADEFLTAMFKKFEETDEVEEDENEESAKAAAEMPATDPKSHQNTEQEAAPVQTEEVSQ